MRVSSSSASSSSKTPCCSKVGIRRGPWTPEEDEILSDYVKREGEGRWRMLPKQAGLQRCGKSCRLRWMNYLRPSIKRGHIAPDEEDLILRLHRLLGNRWSLIAGRIPGRTDNEIKNYWNTHLSKKLISKGIDPRTHKPLNPSPSSPIAADIFKPASSWPPQPPYPNVSTGLDKASGSHHHPISTVQDVPRDINERQLLQKQIETRNWNSSDAVSVMDPQNVGHCNTINNFDSEDMLSSLLDTLMDDNYASPYQWSLAHVPPPSASMVSPTMDFNSQSGLWDAELVKSALESLCDQPDYNNNMHRAQ